MEEIFKSTEAALDQQGFTIVSKDFQRPWGGFFVLDESQGQQFASTYFPEIDQNDLITGRKISPKILLVAPGKRLSWQYHFRRSEVWRVIEGPIAVARSLTDEQGEPDVYNEGDLITLAKGERHRLIGLGNWGKVAEIWQHTDPSQPSDEDDIVRLQDDFGR